MDMRPIERLMNDLRLDNECVVAAEMDVDDCEHALKFAKRKLKVMQARQKATCDKLDEAIHQRTMAPLLLTVES